MTDGGADKVKAVEAEVDDFLSRKGVILAIPKPDAEDYLGMSRDRLSMMTPEELGLIGFEITRYSFYLQTVINGLVSRSNICKVNIERVVGHKLGNYPAVYGREEKWIAAIADDPEATSWKELQNKIQFALDRLAYLPNRLAEIAAAAESLQPTRRRSHG